MSLHVNFLPQDMGTYRDLTRQTKDEESKLKHLHVQARTEKSMSLFSEHAFQAICGELSIAQMKLPL